MDVRANLASIDIDRVNEFAVVQHTDIFSKQPVKPVAVEPYGERLFRDHTQLAVEALAQFFPVLYKGVPDGVEHRCPHDFQMAGRNELAVNAATAAEFAAGLMPIAAHSTSHCGQKDFSYAAIVMLCSAARLLCRALNSRTIFVQESGLPRIVYSIRCLSVDR